MCLIILITLITLFETKTREERESLEFVDQFERFKGSFEVISDAGLEILRENGFLTYFFNLNFKFTGFNDFLKLFCIFL